MGEDTVVGAPPGAPRPRRGLAADGLPVKFTGETRTDIVTFQQWGRPIELSQINIAGGTNETIIIRHKGNGWYLDGDGIFPGWNGTDELYMILRQADAAIDYRVTDDRIAGIRHRGTVVELRFGQPWNGSGTVPNLTEALFVLHEQGGENSPAPSSSMARTPWSTSAGVSSRTAR